MTAQEKREFVMTNKGNMTIKAMSIYLSIKVPMVQYFLYRYNTNPEHKKNTANRWRKKETKPLKKITNESDYSTNGLWDSDKWRECLPV